MSINTETGATPAFVVAYRVPHNEGLEVGIITGPGYDGNGSDFSLVDLFEVDASIQSFGTVIEAQDWLKEEGGSDSDVPELHEVPGGLRGSTREEDEDD